MALSLVFRDRPAARSPFVPDMLKKHEPNEWERAGFWQAFNRVSKLGHCGKAAIGSSRKEKLRRSIVIVLVHRDDFGHGEEGISGVVKRKPYFEKREDFLDSIHVCRIVEAQQVLIRWSLEQLDSLPARSVAP